MLLDFKHLVTKYKIPIKGIISCGTHVGIEVADFEELGFSPIHLIEPCTPQFNVLWDKYYSHPGITLHKVACADMEGSAQMFVETRNNGQSNSLLRPALHTEYYPDIVFHDTEIVEVKRLDSLIENPEDFSVISADVQGAELKVLMGAPELINHLDMIYLEVNRQELYEGAAQIEQIVGFLSDFTCMEESWTGQGWGDAIFIRNSHLKTL